MGAESWVLDVPYLYPHDDWNATRSEARLLADRKGWFFQTGDYGVKPTLRHNGAGWNIRPFANTIRTLRMFEIDSSGFASTTIRSARLPASTVPLSRSSFMARAGTMVAAWMASIGDMPPWTYSSISRYTL